jgi:hypothetical protein
LWLKVAFASQGWLKATFSHNRPAWTRLPAAFESVNADFVRFRAVKEMLWLTVARRP